MGLFLAFQTGTHTHTSREAWLLTAERLTPARACTQELVSTKHAASTSPGLLLLNFKEGQMTFRVWVHLNGKD